MAKQRRITRRVKQDALILEFSPQQSYERAKPAPIIPKNAGQSELIGALSTDQIVCATGIAGSGKTFITATIAADRFRSRDIRRIIITRPNVGLGRSIGFLPGTVDEKMSGWVAPIMEAITARIGKAAVEIAIKHGDIVVQPLETIRGHSYDEPSMLICDEAQNLTVDEVECLTTRCGEGCQIVLMGDLMQRDIRVSGLETAVRMIKHNPKLGRVVDLPECVRSDICAEWIKDWRNK